MSDALRIYLWNEGDVDFHVAHPQKRHGRRGVSRERVSGSAQDVHETSFAKVRGLREADPSANPRLGEAAEGWRRYTGSGYKSINTAARDPGDPRVTDKHLTEVAAMDDAIAYAGVTNSSPIMVHRGVTGDYAQELRATALDHPGTKIVDDGFMSTTTNPNMAEAFSGSRGVRMEITVPAGRQSLAGTDYESELIFGRGTELRIIGMADDGFTVLAVMR